MNYHNQITSERIVNIFKQFMMPTTAIDEFQLGGRDKLIHQINQFTLNGKTIHFAMLGFPFKSTNHRDKTLGSLPDLAEEVAFRNFGNFQKQIKEVYSPGAKITVVSDGYIFNDVLSADESVVAEYKLATDDMAKPQGVDILQLQDFFNSKTSLSQMRAKVMDNFSPTPDELQRRILMDPNVNQLYRGMIRFVEEEISPRGFPSRNQQQKEAKRLVREMMARNEAYSQFMQSELGYDSGNYIRLSMHHSTNNGAKYSFQLIPSIQAHHSPWHCALAIDNGEYVTMHRSEAESMNFQLMEQNGRPYYYLGSQLF